MTIVLSAREAAQGRKPTVFKNLPDAVAVSVLRRATVPYADKVEATACRRAGDAPPRQHRGTISVEPPFKID